MTIQVQAVTVTENLLRFQYKVILDGVIMHERFASCSRNKEEDPLEQAIRYATKKEEEDNRKTP